MISFVLSLLASRVTTPDAHFLAAASASVLENLGTGGSAWWRKGWRRTGPDGRSMTR